MFKKFIKMASGFSMIEVLISMGLIGGVSLASMKLAQFSSDGSRNLEFSREFLKFHSSMQNQLNKGVICNANFSGKPVNSNYQSLVNQNNQTLLANNGTYMNGKVQVVSMSTLDNGEGIDLVINYRKLIKDAQSALFSKRIPLLVNLDITGTQIVDCFDLNQSMSDTVDYLFAWRLCKNTYQDPVDFNKFFDGINRTCLIPGTTTVQCSGGKTIVKIEYDEINKTWKPVCGYPFWPKTCPQGWVKAAKANGTFDCAKISDYIDATSLTFTPPAQCGLKIASNKIKLECL